MSKHISVGLIATLTLLLLMVFTAVPVLAFDARSGDTITLASGEVVNDDLYVAADTITIDGTVNGDLWAGGRTVIVNGAVNGSITAAGQTVNISGDVGHAVRAAGQTINISGSVTGDVMVGCSYVDIASTAEIGGDVLFGAGTARIDGLIKGDIKGYAGEVTIGNEVQGNVNLEVDNLTLLPTAKIQGSLTYTSKEKADTHPDAQIGGTTTHNVPEVKEEPAEPSRGPSLFGVLWKVAGFLMAFIAGLVIILLFPRRIASIADAIRTRPGPSAGWGALVLFVTPIAAIIVCVTLIGLPVGLITLALWGIALYLAQIPVGLFIGRLIIGRFRGVEGKAIMVGALALGLLILKLLGLIPYVGIVISIAVAIFGLGAVVALERKRRAEAREAVSSEP